MANHRVIGSTLRRKIEKHHRAGRLDINYQVEIEYTGELADIMVGTIKLLPTFPNAARATLTAAQIGRLAEHPSITLIDIPESESLDLDISNPDIKADLAWLAPTAMSLPETRGEGVAIAIIDSGIDASHECFLDAEGNTRILYLWDQSYKYNSAGLAVDEEDDPLLGDDKPLDENGADLVIASNRTPEAMIKARIGANEFPSPDADASSSLTLLQSLDYGALFNSGHINTALAAIGAGRAMPISLRDTPDRGDHGTHVAGIAAGDGSIAGADASAGNNDCNPAGTFVGIAPKSHLIVIKTGKGNLISNSAEGVAFAFAIAGLHPSRALPVVANISLGTTFGRHNGLSRKERRMDGMLDQTTGRAIVQSAGNTRNKRSHIAVSIPEDTTRQFTFTVRATDDFKFWMSSDPNSSFTYQLTLPANSDPARQTTAFSPDSDSQVTEFDHIFDADAKRSFAGDTLHQAETDRHCSIEVNPATSDDDVLTGQWSLDVTNGNNGVLHLHIWSKKYKLVKFEDAESGADNSWLKGTLGVGASARSPVSVAAYGINNGQRTIGDFSGAGPAPFGLANGLYPPTSLSKPDIAAPGVGITSAAAEARNCILMCQCCVDEYITKQGTSMSAPHITGVIALMLSVNPNLTHTQIKTILQDNIITPDSTGGDSSGPSVTDLFGAGIVDAERCVNDSITIVTRLASEDSLVSEAIASNRERARAIARRRSGYNLGELLIDLESRFSNRPAWHFVAALVSRHFDEFLRLINTQKKVGAVWQRFGGPALVRKIVFSGRQLDPPVPRTVEDRDVRELVENLLRVVNRFAGPALQADISNYSALAVQLPGQTIDELEQLLTVKPS